MKVLDSRVLIVEDDIELLESLKEILSLDFNEVITAVDGISAFLAIEEQEPDLIFSDIKMPGFDGLELISKLRSEGKNIPVILASGTADREDILKALRLGVSDFVEKPYTSTDVRTAVFRCVEVAARKLDLQKLIEEFGEHSPNVKRQQRMIGLFHVVNSIRK